jgi:hypothetical protein
VYLGRLEGSAFVRLLEPARDYAQTIAKLRLRYSHRTAGKLHKAAIAGAI